MYKTIVMRTNIVLDDDLMAKAIELSKGKTKKDIVNEALSLWVKMKNQLKIRELRGKLSWEGDLEQMRVD